MTAPDRPLLSFDLDGVLARPPFGRNVTIKRNLSLEPAGAEAAHRDAGASPSVVDRLLAGTYYRLRYAFRPPMPGAAEAVAAAAERYRVIVLTARNWRGRGPTLAWLERQGILAHLDQVLLNDTGLPSAQFKRCVAEECGIARHIDDDAATAALLARGGVEVDLIDWPGNRGLDYPPGVTRRLGPQQLLEALRSGDAAG
ncbi:MAG TPA: hypothetical protein QGF05_09370 [Dehalococcoidia bacterium]|nr:hypothetical protein [Dehalococcoidia bacterium]